MDQEYRIRGAIISKTVSLESHLEFLLSRLVSDENLIQFRIKSYFLRYIGFQTKLNLLSKVLVGLGIKDEYSSLIKDVQNTIDLRNIIAHRDYIFRQKNEIPVELGFQQLDQRSDLTTNIVELHEFEEWDIKIHEIEQLSEKFKDAVNQIISKIETSQIRGT